MPAMTSEEMQSQFSSLFTGWAGAGPGKPGCPDAGCPGAGFAAPAAGVAGL